MKYHYQLVSATKVRIELIPENKKEIAFFESLSNNENNEQLNSYFRIGLHTYSPSATMEKLSFMQFPKVALCSFITHKQAIPTPYPI